jgi:hypothetical protein
VKSIGIFYCDAFPEWSFMDVISVLQVHVVEAAFFIMVHGCLLSERVDHKNTSCPLDGHDAGNLLASSVPKEVELPVPMRVQERALLNGAKSYALFDLRSGDLALFCSHFAVLNYDDVRRIDR